MSQSIDTIVAYLEVLHVNRHLIAAAYCQGGIALEDENQRRIRQLMQHRVLIPYFQQDFRISPTLGRHLDEVFQRQRSYAVGANFGDLTNRLRQLIIEFMTASHENRPEDQEDYAAEYDAGVFELASLINDELLSLRAITENQFANVSTMAEKQRQNEFYLDRAEKIGETIALLEGQSLLGTLSDSPLLKPLLEVYRHQVLIRLAGWRSTHMDITAVLKAFLYRLRQIEPNARRIRAFAHFLRKNPDYQPPESEGIQTLPAWSSRYVGLRLKTHPDLSISQSREVLAEIAQSIASAKISIVRERAAGRLINDGAVNSVRVIQPKPVQLAFHRYLQAACDALLPLSAIGWKRKQPEFSRLDDDAWLLYAVHSIEMLGKSIKTGRLRGLEVKRYEAPAEHVRSGNIVIKDVALWKRT
ncbi:MAG: hypothetical protein I8H91_11330 [Burkholderiales bacterium]|nr:hypothetical protein [Burkholderiales bacterium]